MTEAGNTPPIIGLIEIEMSFFAAMLESGRYKTDSKEHEAAHTEAVKALYASREALRFAAHPHDGPFTLHLGVSNNDRVVMRLVPQGAGKGAFASTTSISFNKLRSILSQFRLTGEEIANLSPARREALTPIARQFGRHVKEHTPHLDRVAHRSNSMTEGPWLEMLMLFGACFPKGPYVSLKMSLARRRLRHLQRNR